VAVEKLEVIERRLGVSGKLLIAPVFILLLFALVTFYSIREFQNLDARMDTVARDLAPETAVATGVLINLYNMRLRVFDYYATGNEDILARFKQLETDFFSELSAAQQTIKSTDRVQLVAEIEEATLQYANVFKNELVPAKQQVKISLPMNSTNTAPLLQRRCAGLWMALPTESRTAGCESFWNN